MKRFWIETLVDVAQQYLWTGDAKPERLLAHKFGGNAWTTEQKGQSVGLTRTLLTNYKQDNKLYREVSYEEIFELFL